MNYILPVYPMLKVMSDTLLAEALDEPEFWAFAPIELWNFLHTQAWRDGTNNEQYASRGGSGA